LNKIIIASENSGKIREVKKILSLHDVQFLDPGDMSYSGYIEETGKTFDENALIKAEALYREFELPVIADDSGLCVASLGGEPGVYSARFAGPDATDEQNNRLLLKRLKNVHDRARTAWFSCTAVFYYDSGRYFKAEGKVHGTITHSPVGKNGFGYDPIFFLPEYEKTMAQLTMEEKNKISHRGKAFRKLKEYIEEYIRK